MGLVVRQLRIPNRTAISGSGKPERIPLERGQLMKAVGREITGIGLRPFVQHFHSFRQLCSLGRRAERPSSPKNQKRVTKTIDDDWYSPDNQQDDNLPVRVVARPERAFLDGILQKEFSALDFVCRRCFCVCGAAFFT